LIVGGIYKRGHKLWLWYFDAAGVRVFEPTGSRPGEEARARKTLETIERRVEAEARTGVPVGELTVKAYGERWMKDRPAQGVATADDEARRLRLHAWPLIGNVLLRTSARTTFATWSARFARRSRRGEEERSPDGARTSDRKARLRDPSHDAARRGGRRVMTSNPCVLKRGELPKKIDKDPEWRTGLSSRARKPSS